MPLKIPIGGSFAKDMKTVSNHIQALIRYEKINLEFGKAINKVTFTKIVNSLREQFPNYPTYALELAATARMFGLRRLIRSVAFSNIAKFRNPKEEIRRLASDNQIVNATAYATNTSPAYVQKVLANPTMLQIINPF